MKKISYGRQDINDFDVNAVVSVLRSDFLTQGPIVPAFENSIAEYCRAQYAVAVNSATSALHVACLALGVGKGDCVWTSPITFVATANCALYCGATVDFVDIDPLTFNLSVQDLSAKLALAKKKGSLPKVVIPVHLCGQPCDMAGIYQLSLEYGFKIIEDASHAIGGQYCGKSIGGCDFSDITIFSFHPVKIITTGEGGMAVTNSGSLAKKLRLLRSHGITSDVEDMKHRPTKEIWNYQQIDLGFNYRMTDIQAALGLSQMDRLNNFVEKRQAIARYYDESLSTLPVLAQCQLEGSSSSYHLYVIRLKLDLINKTQRQVYDELRLMGILVNLHYIPIYRQPYYEKMNFKSGYCPQAEKYYSEAISIPIYPSMNREELDFIVQTLHDIILG